MASKGIDQSSNQPVGSEYTFAANDTWRELLWADMVLSIDSIPDSFLCLMQQMAKKKLLKDDLHYVEGIEQSFEDRLFVRQMSFWLMVVLLIVLIALVVDIICFLFPSLCAHKTQGLLEGSLLYFPKARSLWPLLAEHSSNQKQRWRSLRRARHSIVP
jgi:hypothetical protein